MEAAIQTKREYRWHKLEEHSNEREFFLAGEGFNFLARATDDALFLMVFPSKKLQDPVIGLQVKWSEVQGAGPVAGKHAFEFDAGGPYALFSINGVSVTLKIEDEGLAVDVIDPSTEHGEIIRQAYARWEDIAFADDDDGVSIIDDLQSLYRSILGVL